MTGPEHCQAAERLLSDAAATHAGEAEHLVTEAQVHATLALAAAVAEGEHCSNGWTGITAKRQPREAS